MCIYIAHVRLGCELHLFTPSERGSKMVIKATTNRSPLHIAPLVSYIQL